MQLNISNELHWLTLTLMMTSVFWMPYIINRMLEQGILNALWDRYGETTTDKPWAQRMMRAHENAIENLAIFSVLVIITEILSLNSELTHITCVVYFYSRLMHFAVFSFAIPILRVVTFLTGFGAQMTLALNVLNYI